MHQLAEIFREAARGRHPDGQVEVVRGPVNIARAVPARARLPGTSCAALTGRRHPRRHPALLQP